MQSTPQSKAVSVVAVVAAGLVVASFFTPLWWVSLTAPNYPPDRFPDGIRIHFGFTGVSNGCTTPPKTSRAAQETLQEDLGWRSEEGQATAKQDERPGEVSSGLDCVHEMNTINHYVGMRPIGVGAPVEILLSRYILAMFAVMLLGFAVAQRKARVVVLAAGFVAVSAWMLLDLYAVGRLAEFVTRYKEDAARYFNEAERIAGWGATLTRVVIGVSLGFVAVMGVMVFGAWRWRRFQLVLGIVPALLPGYFVIAYAAWLGWFGHRMHPWGAFTLKPFMPTVFGDGQVAQFSTHSYPHWGFALLAGLFVLLAGAVARRRFELAHEPRPADAPPASPASPPATAPAEMPTPAGQKA